MRYDHNGGIRDPLKQDLALEFCKNQNKVISILTETHINHDQIHHIRNNWVGSNFFSLGDSLTKGHNSLSCFISSRLTLIKKEGLCPLMTEFSMFMSLQGIAPGNRWIGGVSLKDYYEKKSKMK